MGELKACIILFSQGIHAVTQLLNLVLGISVLKISAK